MKSEEVVSLGNCPKNLTSFNNQMKNYDRSFIYCKRNPNIHLNHPKRGNQSISGSFQYGIYDVDYKNDKITKGLIVYTVNLNKARARAAAMTVTSIAICILSLGMTSSSMPIFAY